MTVDVELTRTGDAADLAQALEARGIRAQVNGDSGEVTVRADDLVQVEHALDEWAAERGLPFVPYIVDDRRVVVAPPPS